MDDLPDNWKRMLSALADAPIAWVAPTVLADRLGLEPAVTEDLLADLDIAGWICVWDQEDGPTVTLTSWGASQLGLHLVEIGEEESPRWWPVGDPAPPAPRARQVFAKERSALLDFVVDPCPSPLEEAIAAEARTGLLTAPERNWPRPRLLVGSGLTPWPGPSADAKHNCPACGEMPLPAHAYCVRCDRWGLDADLSEALDCQGETPPDQRKGPPSFAARQRNIDRHRQRLKVRRDRLKDKFAAKNDRQKAAKARATSVPNPPRWIGADGSTCAWGLSEDRCSGWAVERYAP